MEQRTLESLMVDVSELDRELLGTLLYDYLRIDRASADVVLVPEGWRCASVQRRVLLYLLARRAARALGLGTASEARPAQMVRALGVPGGSVRPALQRLLALGLVVRTSSGYHIPNRALLVVGAWLGEQEGQQYDSV